MIFYDYAFGDQVFIKIKGTIQNLGTPQKVPYTITYVFINGTIRIQRGNVNGRINIRRLEPFF